ncbi:MAG TPA: HAMP domain-containing sensor histidine kinase [Candidatus Paceibacterota bacterium]|nr:HAMP domain-containing sensor histidine kinase [Candidatus Paceibacterota bacterium]
MEPMTLLRLYSKRFAAWATVWREKYEADIFLRASVNIALLLSGLVLACVALFWFALHYTNEAVVRSIIENIQAIVSGSGNSGPLTSSIASIQGASVWFVFFSLVGVAVVFALLFSKYMLLPARNTLHYQKLFISNVAHELRTPLSVIKTSTEVALMDDGLPPTTKDVLGDIVRELDRISEIINNLLSLNTLNRPERMQLSNVSLSGIADTVIGRLDALARERNIELTFRKEGYDVVWGNATGLEQVVSNIIKNAINYTQKSSGGVVSILIRPDYRGSIIFSVSDNGIGISQKDLAHIFEPFYRADTSRVRNIRHGGSGLGLAIVSEIVRGHHGKISIESARTHGTTVSVSLPVGRTKEQQEERLSPPGVRSEMSIDFSHGRAEQTPPSASEEA